MLFARTRDGMRLSLLTSPQLGAGVRFALKTKASNYEPRKRARQREDDHEPTLDDLRHLPICADILDCIRLGRPAQVTGSSFRSVGHWPARLFLRRRAIHRRRWQEHHARPSL